MINEKIVGIFEAVGFSNKLVLENDGIVCLYYDNFLNDLVADDEFVQKNIDYFKRFKLEVIFDSSDYFSIRLDYVFEKSDKSEKDIALYVMNENFGLRGAKIIYCEGEDFYRLMAYRNFKVSELAIMIFSKVKLYLRGFVLTCLERMARIIYSISSSEKEPLDYSVDQMNIIKVSDLERDRGFYVDSFRDRLVERGDEILKYDFATVIFRPDFLKGEETFVVVKFFPDYGVITLFLALGKDANNLNEMKINELNSSLKFGKLEVSPQKDRFGIQYECFLSPELKDDFVEFDFGLEVLSVFYSEYLKMNNDKKMEV